MSASRRAVARRYSAAIRASPCFVAVPLILTVLAVGLASAELPSGVTRISAADAERSGSAIHLLRQAVGRLDPRRGRVATEGHEPPGHLSGRRRCCARRPGR